MVLLSAKRLVVVHRLKCSPYLCIGFGSSSRREKEDMKEKAKTEERSLDARICLGRSLDIFYC